LTYSGAFGTVLSTHPVDVGPSLYIGLWRYLYVSAVVMDPLYGDPSFYPFLILRLKQLSQNPWFAADLSTCPCSDFDSSSSLSEV
jgi:hypothetical protein